MNCLHFFIFWGGELAPELGSVVKKGHLEEWVDSKEFLSVSEVSSLL
jgi:hypothetical protein